MRCGGKEIEAGTHPLAPANCGKCRGSRKRAGFAVDYEYFRLFPPAKGSDCRLRVVARPMQIRRHARALRPASEKYRPYCAALSPGCTDFFAAGAGVYCKVTPLEALLVSVGDHVTESDALEKM